MKLSREKDQDEQLEEIITEIEKAKDPTIDLFVKLMKTMPELDHISATKRLKS